MPLIQWTPDLAVGVDKIDDQHKKLFQAADDLAEAMWSGKGAEEVSKTIRFLIEYTHYHFRDEEATMTQESYPGLAEQQRAHTKFTDDMGALGDKLEAGSVTSSDAIQVLTTACNWFREHIKVMDKALGDFLKEKA